MFIHCCSCNFTSKSDLDISVWDITLTSCLLLEVIDLGQKQAIHNLRNLRNSKALLHRGNAEMNDDEYEGLWASFTNNIKEVAEKCESYFYSSICKDVDRLKNRSLEQWECYRAQECWKELKHTNGTSCADGEFAPRGTSTAFLYFLDTNALSARYSRAKSGSGP
uniref:Uncharacterized protein n=1 Tax=Magallana gigas TaxID=29159 RepID=K1QMX9_MAGGI